jgi:hypothetical protein
MTEFTQMQERQISRAIWFDSDGEMNVNCDLNICNGNIKIVRANVGEVWGDVRELTGKVLSSENANLPIEGKFERE